MITLENVAYLLQPAVIVFYSALAVEFYFRYHSRAPIRDKNKETGVQSRGEYTRKLKLMTYTMAFSTVLLFIRQVILRFTRSCIFHDLSRFQGNIPYNRARGRLEWKDHR